MTFKPAVPAEPPQASQSPIEPTEEVLDAVEQVIGHGRQQLQDARSSALRAAETQGERDAINTRFDELTTAFGEGVGRIEAAITSGNAALLAGLEAFTGRVGSAATATDGQGDASVDDDIVSVEEIAEGAADLADAAVAPLGAAVDAAAEIAEDVAPRRDHPLFRRLWGGGGG